MKDSQGKTYSADVLDMLVRTYRFMVIHKFKFTKDMVYVADHQSTGMHSSDKYCEKFVQELPYIKELAKNQPTTTITYKRRMYTEADGWIEIGEEETEVCRTYEERKMSKFMFDWKYDKTITIKKVVEELKENLVNSK